MASAPRMASALSPSQVVSEFCSDVVVGLSHPGQKELPSKYLYDEVGSALFDVICLLPEYGLSRAGMRTLQNYAGEIVDRNAGQAGRSLRLPRLAPSARGVDLGVAGRHGPVRAPP